MDLRLKFVIVLIPQGQDGLEELRWSAEQLMEKGAESCGQAVLLLVILKGKKQVVCVLVF